MTKLKFYLSILLLAFAVGCGNSPAPKVDPSEKELLIIPDFSSDSAYAFIQKQVDFGPRVPKKLLYRFYNLVYLNYLPG